LEEASLPDAVVVVVVAAGLEGVEMTVGTKVDEARA
jgi:hypothetical protein